MTKTQVPVKQGADSNPVTGERSLPHQQETGAKYLGGGMARLMARGHDR
jgi:hypothetical protein